MKTKKEAKKSIFEAIDFGVDSALESQLHLAGHNSKGHSKLFKNGKVMMEITLGMMNHIETVYGFLAELKSNNDILRGKSTRKDT